MANSILSAGLHHTWKRQAVEAAMLLPDDHVLDAGAGTGDLTLLALRLGCRVTAVDVSAEMLRVAEMKVKDTPVSFVAADIQALPFPGSTFDAVITGFTLRHPTDLSAALRELHRVLRIAGRLVILEFSRPVSAPVRWLYRLYSSALIPALGGWLTGDRDAYAHLVTSIRRFPDQKNLVRLIAQAGFEAVAYRNLTGGIVAVHTAMKRY